MRGERNRILETVRRVLSGSGWSYDRIPDEPAFKLIYKGPGGRRDIIIFADKEKRTVSFICPELFKAEDENPEILKLINDLNSNILMGKLIYLENQKTISAVITIPCNPQKAGTDSIARALQILLAIVEHVTPYIVESYASPEKKASAGGLSFPFRKNDPLNIN